MNEVSPSSQRASTDAYTVPATLTSPSAQSTLVTTARAVAHKTSFAFTLSRLSFTYAVSDFSHTTVQYSICLKSA